MDNKRIYSCDDHIDLWHLPPDLWTARMATGLHAQIPHVIAKKTGDAWMAGERFLGPSRMARPEYSAISRAGIEDDGLRASTPHLRLADMDLDGIWASVIYGPSLLGLQIPDPELKADCLRTYNDWGADFNANAPERLCVLPVLPTHDPAAAVSELERIAKLGHRGAIFYNFETSVADPRWEPLWQACAASGLPLSFHIGGGTSLLQPKPGSWQLAAWAAIAPLQLDEPLMAMLFSGALERNPGMTLVLAEAGIGWVPYALERMDGAFGKHTPLAADYRLREKPSDLFRRQVLVTFEEEPQGPRVIPLIGEDNVMWASDYPHPDSTFPHSRQAIIEAFEGLDDRIRDKATSETCQRLYKF